MQTLRRHVPEGSAQGSATGARIADCPPARSLSPVPHDARTVNSSLSVTLDPRGTSGRGSGIWEVLPDGYLLAIQGRATGSAR